MFNFLEMFFTEYGYVAVFSVLVLCGMGIPIPEDVTLVTGGVISGLGLANPHIMVLVGFLGVMIGDSLMFLAGRKFGNRILGFRLIARVMTPKRYQNVQDKFDKYGSRVLFIARFLPGLRTPIFITAGISKKVSFLQFFIMDGLAALISVPVWVYLGVYGAENTDWLMQKVHQFQFVLLILLTIGAIILGYFWYKKRQKKLYYKKTRSELKEKRNSNKEQNKA